jgi:hypothetical protein
MAVYVNQAGNVGIGTTGPSEMLEVGGVTVASRFRSGQWRSGDIGFNGSGSRTFGWDGTITPGNYGAYLVAVHVGQSADGSGSQTIGMYAVMGGSSQSWSCSQLGAATPSGFGSISCTGGAGHVQFSFNTGNNTNYATITWLRIN